MKAIVRLYGNLRRYLAAGQDVILIDLPSRATVATVIDIVGIDRGEIGLITLNGQIVPEDAEVDPEASIGLFSIIGGG